MSVIIENKKNINYIKTIPAQIQQKLPWTLLEKVFITKKRTQCEPSYMLKTDVFELSNNKDIGKLFSKYVFLDQANFSFNPSQILILQYPILWDSLPHFPILLNCTMANWNPSPTQSSSCSSSVSLFCPIAFDHTPQLLDIPNHMPSQTNQIYYQDIGQIRYPPKSWVLRAASLSRLGNTVISTLTSIQSVLNLLQNGRYSFIFTTLLVHTASHLYNLHQKFSSANFQLPILPLPVHKIILTIPIILTFPSSIRQDFFTSLCLCTAILTIYIQSIFLNHLANSSHAKGPGS